MELNITVFLQLAIFLFLFGFLSEVLFKPMIRLFEERERRIDGAATEAKRLRDSADAAADTIDQRLASAQLDARKVLADLRDKGAAVEKKLVDDARAQAQARLDDQRGELFAMTEDAKATLKDDADKLAGEIVQKVLGRAA